MTSIGDIFDLSDGTEGNYHDEEPKKEKMPRKKAEMSDEKKTAMLERLKAGREKRAENLKAKKEPKEENVVKQPEVKKEVISEKKDTFLKKTNEDERLSFIKMMAGKSKPVEKQSQIMRPKKKVYSEPKEEQKQEIITKPIATPAAADPKPITAPVVVAAPIVKVPVIIRNFKKPIWG